MCLCCCVVVLFALLCNDCCLLFGERCAVFVVGCGLILLRCVLIVSCCLLLVGVVRVVLSLVRCALFVCFRRPPAVDTCLLCVACYVCFVLGGRLWFDRRCGSLFVVRCSLRFARFVTCCSYCLLIVECVLLLVGCCLSFVVC